MSLCAGPIFNDPVVVGLYAGESQVLVSRLAEGLSAEARESIWEAKRGLHVILIHVGQTVGPPPAPGTNFVERGRKIVDHLPGPMPLRPGSEEARAPRSTTSRPTCRCRTSEIAAFHPLQRRPRRVAAPFWERSRETGAELGLPKCRAAPIHGHLPRLTINRYLPLEARPK